jgi:hypothetical protein
MDWARPNRWVRSRISDPRVTQFWDKDHLVAKELERQLPADMQLHCCRRKGVLWDIVALYSRDTQWEHASPDFVDGPVVKATDRMEKALRKTIEKVDAGYLSPFPSRGRIGHLHGPEVQVSHPAQLAQTMFGSTGIPQATSMGSKSTSTTC